MRFRYLPMTDSDQREMLETIGVSKVEQLFEEIPPSVRLNRPYQLPPPMAEGEIVRHMQTLARKNRSLEEMTSFLGAGVYEHEIPSVVGHMIGRSEFYTAYTPYQPEISQGELQAMFEFQTMICELTGMDVTNSSMYDGFTALAEAASMAASSSGRKRIVISKAVHPEALQILHTYAPGFNLEVVEVPYRDGITDLNQLQAAVNEEVAAVIVQSPNFFGSLEPLAEIEPIAHAEQGMFVVSSNPLSMGILQPPGAFGADIVVGDAQPFGITPSFGGPHCGIFATRRKWMRKIPGRIVGQTKDEAGKRGFVLTLQAREQHIRRDKATSNICSNQALNALAASVYLSTMGKQGLREVAWLNMQKAAYAKRVLSQIQRVTLPFSQPIFNEFVVRLPRSVTKINERLLEKGIIGGFDLENIDPSLAGHMLLAVTEVRSKQEIDQLAESLEEIL